MPVRQVTGYPCIKTGTTVCLYITFESSSAMLLTVCNTIIFRDCDMGFNYYRRGYKYIDLLFQAMRLFFSKVKNVPCVRKKVRENLSTGF